MQMTIIVETQEEFDKWMSTKKPYYAKAEAPAEAEKKVLVEVAPK